MSKPVVIVSASTSGLGLAISRAFLEKRYFVYINGRDENKSLQVFEKLSAEFGSVGLLQGDVNVEDNYAKWHKELAINGHCPSVIIANAGNGRFSNDLTPSTADFASAFQQNLMVAVSFTQGFLPFLEDGSAIMFVNSIAGVRALGAPMPYACAKAALHMYAQELARRLAHRGIRVNSVSPGNLMFTGSTWENKLQQDERSTLAYIKNNVPLERFVSPQSVASAVVNVCENADLTGHNLVIDAGQLIGKQYV